jgi:hypothetical protein
MMRQLFAASARLLPTGLASSFNMIVARRALSLQLSSAFNSASGDTQLHLIQVLDVRRST